MEESSNLLESKWGDAINNPKEWSIVHTVNISVMSTHSNSIQEAEIVKLRHLLQ